ncbi:hypothetical protein PZA11_002343 [Diplocarpon coronariae]|uniref:DRBM domain-containing protein n=1 Tax=Diplocarpon coronariae TaxID=2795749 RepID=A0A218YVM3_9HELO|nr:hypothetical protein JHW43_001523 [Diplocarpon mali]OWO98500.1 hypothetical protein B2J93_2235 [Marssonina coronariae]
MKQVDEAHEAISLSFKDMDAFTREQEEKDASEAANTPVPVPAAKKPKPTIDLEALAIEQLANEEMGDKNWIGTLQQYRDVHPVAGADNGIIWDESQDATGITLRFRCTLTIAESSELFGNNSLGYSTKIVSFGTKKQAKKYAAKKAIDWLIENKYMPADGSVKFPKVTTPPAASKARINDPKDVNPSYTSLVPVICTRLGFAPPRYELAAVVQNGSLWNGFANFGMDPRIDGKVGEVKNVFGKKHAKEAIAKLVYAFMKDIENQRNEEDKKRKRSLDSSPDSSIKTNKI